MKKNLARIAIIAIPFLIIYCSLHYNDIISFFN